MLEVMQTPELAAEVTLQPIRRYGFDAAILFADILLVPQALGADLWFVTGEGPRLSTITDQTGVDALKPVEDIHETLNPIYQTVRNLASALPSETTLIGFAGAPWTVATYMIAGQGTPDCCSAGICQLAQACGPSCFGVGICQLRVRNAMDGCRPSGLPTPENKTARMMASRR